jgi:AcrR family transcriptional regulator
MPALIDPYTRSQLVADAVNEILVLDGASGVSMRALARRTGVSAASLLHHLESREHILRVAARLTARASIADISSRRMTTRVGGQLDAHLPRATAELREVSVWLAWAEFARHAEFLQPTVGRWHLEERALLGESVVETGVPRSAVTRAATDAVFAHLSGLRLAMCRPLQPLEISAARESLREILLRHRCRRSVA